MPYVPIENFEKFLFEKVPALANWLAQNKRVIHYGLFPVGLKIHCTAPLNTLGRSFNYMIERLGGVEMLSVNHYRIKAASFCLVLPPVGSAEAAITLIKCLEHAGEVEIFNNPIFQIQVCTPGRLDVEKAGILTIAAVLGAERVFALPARRVKTTFSQGDYSPRGVRFTIYDGHGRMDRDFGWWRRTVPDKTDKKHVVLSRDCQLPFKRKRTDVLTATSPRDISTINFVATILMHAHMSNGYWLPVGRAFIEVMREIIARHQITFDGVQWVCTDESKGKAAQSARDADDELYAGVMYEIYSYVSDELKRLVEKGTHDGILFEVCQAIAEAMRAVEQEVRRLDLKKWRPS